MSAVRLRIGTDGCVRGLHTDAVEWAAVGRVRLKRASHVEFCSRRQAWYVRLARPRAWWRRGLQWLLRCPCGEILCGAQTRAAALEWEARFFAPGGAGYSAHAGIRKYCVWLP